MRKPLLLLILAALFPLAAFAQKAQIGIFYLPQKTSISNSISDKGDPIYKNKMTFAGGGGINFNYWFSENMGIEIGAMYISHNQKFKSKIFVTNDSTKEWKGKKRLDYFKVPIMLTYSYPMMKRIHFIMYGGAQLGYLIKGNGAIVVFQHYNNGASDYYDLPPSGNSYYNKFVVDLVAGGGVNFRLSPQFTATTSLRIDWSITDVENKNADYINGVDHGLAYSFSDPNRKKAHNNSIGVLMGINYTFGAGDHLLSPSQKWY